jgi:hypothetical protein
MYFYGYGFKFHKNVLIILLLLNIHPMVIVIFKKINKVFLGGGQIDLVSLTMASFLSLVQRCQNFSQTYL